MSYIYRMKKYLYLAVMVLLLLMIPFVAMQFSDEVNWSMFDFVVAGTLLYILGISIDAVIRKRNWGRRRIVWVALILMLFFLIWAELAVGIFGSPFAGS